jgi:hypothetical protein
MEVYTAFRVHSRFNVCGEEAMGKGGYVRMRGCVADFLLEVTGIEQLQQ